MTRTALSLIPSVLLVLAIAGVVTPLAQRPPAPPEWPGAKGGGAVLLPNGWTVAPAGRSVQVGDFPMSMVLAPEGRRLIISNSGWSKPSLTIVDTEQAYVSSRVSVDHAWLGLAWHPDGKRLYSSGAAENTINEFSYVNGGLVPTSKIVIDRPAITISPRSRDLGGTGFIGGLAIHPGGQRGYAAHVLGRALSVVDLAEGQVLRTVDLPAEPYTATLTPDGSRLFVSLWGGAKVLELAPELTLAAPF